MREVFAFTFKQNTKGKGFIFSTFILPVLLCAIIIGATMIMAHGDSEEYISDIEKIYIDNQTDIEYMDFSEFNTMAGEAYAGVECVIGGTPSEDETKALSAVVTEESDEYVVTLSVPEWSEINTDDNSDIIPVLTQYISQLRTIDLAIKAADDNVDVQAMMMALMPVEVTNSIEGNENVGIGAYIFEMFAPLILIFILYMMVLLYGQSISKSVISEKVSKLMETLLTTVKPVSLISGKILAMVSIAIIQMTAWFAGIILGIVLGDIVAKRINPDFDNVILMAFDMIKDSNGEMAFSVPAVLLSLLTMIIGFVFFCTCAALVSSTVSKSEELASAMGIYQVLVVLGFLGSYMLPLQSASLPVVLDKILHIVPVTSAFLLPGNIIVGELDTMWSVIYIAILVIFTVLVAVFTGKIYKNQVFYNNSAKGTMSRIIGSLKRNN